MAIITISRGSYSRGKEVAEKVATRLGYECVSRDVLLAAAGQFNLPEIKLVRALHDAPSVLERFTFGREKYIAFIRSAFLNHVKHDNVVYHGLAGHFFLQGVAHALKVRIVADMADRVALEVAREGISPDEALRVLQKDDGERRRWSLALYGIDTADAGLYDIVIRIRKLTTDDAANLICRTAALTQFQKTPQSQAVLDDLVLAAQVKARLVERFPETAVMAAGPRVTVDIKGPANQEPLIVQTVKAMAWSMDKVEQVQVNFYPTD